MITRVTSQSMSRFAQQNLQSNMERLARLQEAATGQSKITRPSDDPSGTADTMRVRADQRANEQYKRNIDDAAGWLATLDSALGSATDALHRVRDLAVRSGSGSVSDTGREAIALELSALKDELLAAANTRYMGRSVFAGNSDAPAVFAPSADGTLNYEFTGPAAGSVERRVDAATTVRVDADGRDVFGTEAGGDSAFALLDAMVADLRAGKPVNGYLADIDARLKTVVAQRAEAGVRHAQVLRAQEANMEQSVSLEARRSSVEDPDVGQVILDLKLQEVAYQSALAVTARVLQPTLMDFLR
ncbi:flagellar hook-associated protein FlgL [Arthrobacter mobilis]|uniref:Flagellar hook-associated protein FlgL n=1 Tax=Arthrobacter mobilis TaxID=2724944 RepID=A0A7X6HAP3_9MICC|nr:flagellar hook-associated protein FlgL [Arthrobacter mobilis]NKX53599.1 flagellar hook-associated protein FlgL [Arthrobacter mobilis]